MNPYDREAAEAHVAKLTAAITPDNRSAEIAAKAAAERERDEQHVKQLTADFVASRTQPVWQTSEVARNLLKVVSGKDNDPAAIDRAVHELHRFRGEPEVDAFFEVYERAAKARLIAARILALKRGGLLKKIGGEDGQ